MERLENFVNSFSQPVRTLGVLLQPPPLELSPPTLPEVREKMTSLEKKKSRHKLSHSRETGSDMTWTNLPPARCTQTPHISRFEAWESSSWGGEVVALALGVLQETLGHLKEHLLLDDVRWSSEPTSAQTV